tara:strand:+ start:14673 stop:14987 length:315 start_codon:yes stop_codon:yes gene_type:complete
MEIHRQRCQNCDSLEVQNLLTREQGEPDTVYVRCAQCGELVARYRLRAYYHHGKGIDSFLRTQGGSSLESGREALADFERAKSDALKGFQKVMEQLESEGKPLD